MLENKKSVPEQARAFVLALTLALAFCLSLGLNACSDDYGQSYDSSASQSSSSNDSQASEANSQITSQAQTLALDFRSDNKLQEHYEKHGIEMGFSSPEEYRESANMVVADPDSLFKLEAEDGDYVFYRESSNEFVIVSTDGYLRTYFCPEDGIDYFNRQ